MVTFQVTAIVKKIQLFLVVAAVLIAGSGVFAGTLYDHNYYRKSTPMGAGGSFVRYPSTLFPAQGEMFNAVGPLLSTMKLTTI